MKKKYKILLVATITAIILGVASFFVYRNYNASKILKKGMQLTSQKEYDKALAVFDLELDYKSNDKEALEAKDMIEKYLDSKNLFDKNKVEDANKEIKEISNNYTNFDGLKSDVNNLKKQIDNSIENIKKINKVKDLINEKKYTEAEKLIKNVEKEKLNEDQKQQTEKLKEKVGAEILRIEAEKKSKEEAKRLEEENREIEENKKNFNSFDRAVELVKKTISGYDNLIYEGVANRDQVLYYQFCLTGTADYGGVSRYLVPINKSNNVYLLVWTANGNSLYLVSS
ncbi:hypothetical protein K5V21_13150 [Clostridium sardiniense]|uniref:Uncharacterized protein n=1 Tax=Clostridium sardiniense TaxID=29369 RepID=A0ABS7L0M2_CLOSR|nr:hypothetical protein [Clostridium sardiniense]MBY0756397.1 hypothetical protein [Clostridium sardiniense]MDQ0459243.1 DNA repair exonuclease SbcCD ATPase subunit [Clostridium sardiniense]